MQRRLSLYARTLNGQYNQGDHLALFMFHQYDVRPGGTQGQQHLRPKGRA